MSKNKKMSPDYSQYETLYTADQYKQKQKNNLNTLYTADQYKQEIERRKKEQQQWQEQQRQERQERLRRYQEEIAKYNQIMFGVTSEKLGKIMYGGQWHPGMSPQGAKFLNVTKAMQDEKTKEKQAKQEPIEEAAGFADWSAAANLLDPKSKFNTELLPKMGQQQQDYWQGIKNRLQPQEESMTRIPGTAMSAKEAEKKQLLANAPRGSLAAQMAEDETQKKLLSNPVPGTSLARVIAGLEGTGSYDEYVAMQKKMGLKPSSKNAYGSLQTKLGKNEKYNKLQQDALAKQMKIWQMQIDGMTSPTKNYTEWINEMNLLKDEGLYGGNDLQIMSTKQVKARLNELNAKLGDYYSLTEEEQAEMDAKLDAQRDKTARYNQAVNSGIPFTRDTEGNVIHADAKGFDPYSNQYEYITRKPDDYKGNEDAYDALLYDWIHGEGAWEQIVDTYSIYSDEFDAAWEETQELWDQLESGEMAAQAAQMAMESAEYESDIRGFWVNEVQRQIELAEAELQRRQTAKEYEANAPEGSGEKDLKNNPIKITFNKTYNDAQNIYAALDVQDRDIGDFGKMIGENPGQYMNEEQRKTFTGYYENGQYEEAMAYYNALEPWLRTLMIQHKTALEQKMYNEGWSIPMSAYRIATKPVEGTVGMIATAGALLGNKDWADPKNAVWDLARTNANIQNTSAQAWGKQAAKWFGEDAEEWGRFFNGVFFSMADNLVAMGIAGGFGGVDSIAANKLSMNILQYVMSSEATASTMLQRLESGQNPTEAALYAYGSGVIEWVTERVSIEALLKPNMREILGKPKELMKFIGKAALAEGTEEINADLLGAGLDYILTRMYDDKTELEQQVEALLAENKDMSRDEAWKQVALGFLKQMGMSGLAGALSGAMLAGGRAGNARYQSWVQNNTWGQNIRNYGTNEVMTEEQRQARGQENLQQFIRTAGLMNPETQSAKQATKLQEMLEQGKKISNRELGMLYRFVMEESSETVRNMSREILTEEIGRQLRAMDEVPGAIQAEAQALARLITGETSRADLGIISQSMPALQLLSQFKMGGKNFATANAKIREQTGQTQSVQEILTEMVSDPEKRAQVERGIQRIMDGAQAATEEEIRSAEGRSTGEANEIVNDGKIDTIETIQLETDEDGKAHWTARTAQGETVDLGEVKATNKNTAQILQYLAQDAGQMIGTQTANTLIQLNTKHAAQTVNDALRIITNAYLGRNNPQVRLDGRTAQTIREAAEADYRLQEAKRTAQTRQIRPGEGRVTYKGKLAGTRQFNDQMKRLDRTARNEARAIESIAKSAGWDVELYYDKNDTANQGSFTPDGGIRINLAGTFNREGAHRSALATLAHEATHWLAINSPTAYRGLRSYVLNSMAQHGFNVQQELEGTIRNYGAHDVHLDLYGAIEEVVAKGCEQVLTDEKVVRAIKEKDPKLAGKIRQAVQALINRINLLRHDTAATSSRYARGLAEYADRLGELWLETYAEAKNAETRSTGEARVQNAVQENMTEADRVLQENGEIAYEPAQYSFAGEEAQGQYGEDVRMAYRMARDGATEEQIREATKCIPGYDGRWWRVLDNNNMKLTITPEEIEEGKTYKLADIYDAEELYKAYPRIGNATVVFDDFGQEFSGSTEVSPNGLFYTIKINTRFRNGAESIEATLQHELQHIIQGIERTQSGANVTFWKNMQDYGRARIEKNDQLMNQVMSRYGVDTKNELAWGIELNEDGTVNEEYLFPEEYEKVKNIPTETLQLYKTLDDDNQKWNRILKDWQSPASLYRDTVGEIEARAAAEKTSENTRINYPEGYTVAREDFTGEQVSEPGHTVQYSVAEMDAKYEEAVKEGDWRTAEQMLLQKMEQTEGITGYRAPHFYIGEHKDIARLIKSGDRAIIQQIVNDMAEHVPDNAVLVPMPPHEGKVTAGTDTMILANELSKVTGAPVIVALESDYHESRYKAKAEGNRNVNANTMGFRQVAEIPEGKMPVFIDNMVGGGQTAMAARNAIGRGITLAYAQSSRSKSQGVKAVTVTYDSKNRLIPLSQRMDPNNKSWKYSFRDEDYMAAVNSGDMETAQWMVDQKAEEAFANSKIRGKDGKLLKVFHGTNADFNVFDTNVDGGKNGIAEGYGIYLSDNPEVTEKYGDRQIGAYLNMQRPARGDTRTIRKNELTKLIRAAAEYEASETWEDEGYDSKEEKLKDTWITGYVYTHGYRNINEAYADVADKIMQFNNNDADVVMEIMSALGIRDYSSAMNFYHNILTPTTGIDGYWQQWKNTETGEKSNIFLAFDSSQIKEADPVTYDDDGNVIPLSERFNAEQPDIRYSVQDETDYDVRQWLETVPEWSLQTEAEKELLKTYGNLRMKVRLDGERIRKTRNEIRVLENRLNDKSEQAVQDRKSMEGALEDAGISIRDGHWLQQDGVIIGKIENDGTITMHKSAPRSAYQAMKEQKFDFNRRKATYRTTPLNAPGGAGTNIINVLGENETQKRLDALKKKLAEQMKSLEDAEQKLAQVTGDAGFGRMMYQQQRVLEGLRHYETQEQMAQAAKALEQTAERIGKRIEENKREVEKLNRTEPMQRVREILESTTAKQAAAQLKKEFHSTWTQAQILPYISEIAAKMTAGQDFMDDVERLAEILIESDSRNVYEGLSALRGLTITLGKSAQRELRAKNSSLAEIRQKLEGTGIKVKFGETSTLDTDIEDLRAEYPDMPHFENNLDAMDEFIEWVNGMRGRLENEYYAQYKAEAAAKILQQISAVMKNGQLYVPDDAKARQQIMDLVEYMKGLNAETAEAEKALADVAKQLEGMKQAGLVASRNAQTLMRDVNVALDYYSRISRIAVDEAKQQKTSAIIEQMKSDFAQKMLKNNEEWRELLKRDSEAREQAEDNRRSRGILSTDINRMMKLLKNPKGLQNIPEYMQGLAREVIGQVVRNDTTGGRKLSLINKQQLMEIMRLLNAWEMRDGKFDATQLQLLDPKNVKADIIQADLETIRNGLRLYNGEINGKNKLDTLRQRGAILQQIQEAITEIYTAIKAEGQVQMTTRRVAVEDAAEDVKNGTKGKRFREWRGKLGGGISTLHKFIVSGNMTPVYFFRMLENEGLSALWENYHDAENRNGLELWKAKVRLAEIAQEYGYKEWDLKEKIKVQIGGEEVELTLGQVMSLWATWNREQTLGPEMSEHLTKGGFYAEQDLREGLLGREAVQKRAHRVNEADMARISDKLTDQQKQFVNAVVGYMSNDMSQLGNAASMAAYGIKLYKESYYFPFQIWDGVKNRKSNDAGSAAGAGQDRAFHPSFSKSRMYGADNALVIGDFMQTAADHIAGMINYATMGLANESLNKVLNQQVTEGTEEDATKRNVRAILEEAYGREALQYLMDLKVQLEGGAVKIDKTFYDKLISAFRKNAVAGSLSVALQQPLSYLRAAMLIDSKYLARAISPDMWKGSYQEMLKHSGVAVIKEMGRFDMNFGASAREYLTPDGKKGKAQAAWDWTTEKATILPELMDRMTWTRMWSAVKAEQHAAHPEMDMKSEAFLNLCGVRFNEIMRRTQVYDSVLVKSANMRTQNPAMKMLTSFMAEPTLTMNVLADSIRQAVQHEKGGLMQAWKAGMIFLLSAVFQAAVKGTMGARRNPDDKKTWGENFWYRFMYNFIGEVNPLQLIPGYDELITALKGGDISDDAMGTISKLVKSVDKASDLIGGRTDDPWRGVEDSVGQLVQLFSKLPMKNIMRDVRATWNWVAVDPYAKRADSAAVLKYQTIDTVMNSDSLIGAINKKLGEAGWETTNSAYYGRIYEAKKAGDEQAAQDMIEYLLKGKGVKDEKTIMSNVASAAKKDPDAGAAETAEFLIGEGADAESYIKDQMKDGKLTAEEARKLLQKANPEKSAEDIWWTVDRIQYQLETGAEKVSGNYYRLWDAMDENKAEGIRGAVKTMLEHGMDPKNIKTQITKQYKSAYLEANSKEKVKIKDAIEKAYKELGYSKEDADKIINKWK